MSELRSKRFDEPDEVVTMPLAAGQIVVLGGRYVGRYVHQPGWKWSVHVKPDIGTPSCLFHHEGVVLSGSMGVVTDEGARRTIGAGEVYEIPPGHDAWVIGDEPCVTLEFRGVEGWGRPEVMGERVLATLLMTDIVDSTVIAGRLGDAAWKRLIARHADRVRAELDRFRGYEVEPTGDGMLAMFDGAARAVQCAAAICKAVREDGVEVRAGVHSGEVERHTGGLRGITVHTTARVAAVGGAGDVMVSAPTVALVEGSGLRFDDAGEHELKGIPGARRIFRLAQENE